MKSYVWLTFGFLGWAYYETSGGSDFVPAQTETVIAEIAQADVIQAPEFQAPEIVARASTPTLLAVSTSNIAVQAVVSPSEVSNAAAAAAALDAVDTALAVQQAAIIAPEPAVELTKDFREVSGSRVNLRMGPGTGFDVITTLNSGTKLEVLDTNPDGWVNVATVDRGIEGWMAERLLTDTDI